MDERSISISIRATEESGDVGELYDAAWSLLAATVRKNAKHVSAKEILGDYLDEAEDDGRGFCNDKHLEFSFQSPASACDVQMEVATHWFELAIALASRELIALCSERGFVLKPPRAKARELASAVRKVSFVPNGDSIVGIKRGTNPVVLVDARESLAIDEADLTPAARKLARAAAKSGKCACTFCANVRSGKAVVVKPKSVKVTAKTHAAPVAAGADPTSLETFTSLPKALRAPERCGSLELRGKVDALPKDIGKLRRMTSLDVSENGLSKLPAALFTLTALETLNLSGSSFGALPSDIAKLVALKTLHLSRTSIEALPDAIGDLPALEVLSLDGSSLETVPRAVLRLGALRRLVLSNLHRLSAPMPELSVLTRLESLGVANSRRVAGVFDAIDFSALESLVELDLNWSDIPCLPPSLENLRRLETLNIERCAFTELPASFATLTGLTELKAFANKFTKWPSVLDELPNLKIVGLRSTKITNLDGMRSLPALEWLSLAGTPLTELPSRAPHLPSLQCLVLEDTGVSKLPPWVLELPSLKLLRIAGTPLADGDLTAMKRARRDVEIKTFSSRSDRQ